MSLRKKRLTLLRLAMVPVVLLPVFVPDDWSTRPLADFVLETAGYLFLMAGLGLRMWSIIYIGARKSKELITVGPYSLCRNPLYIGSFSIYVGAALLFTNLPMLAGVLLVMVPIHAYTTIMEERHLREIFGPPFDEYCRRVPRFLFAFRNYTSPEYVEASTRSVRRIAIDAVGVLSLPLLEDLLELLHHNHLLPTIWTISHGG